MADDLDFACPRCGKEPKRGKFLGSKIWHDECLIEDLIEKFKAGTPREEIEKTLKRVKDQSIENKVGLECGWPEYQPKKTAEELEAEYQAELEAAEAKAEAEKAKEEGDAAAAAEAEEKAKQAEEKAKEVQDAADERQKISQAQQNQSVPNAQASGASSSPVSPPPVNPPMPISYPNQMPMMAPAYSPQKKSDTARDAPTDPVIRNITISAMNVCLRQMKKDIEYGKLLFKMIKEFKWANLDKNEKSDEKSENEDQPELDVEDEDGLRPFLVEP